MDALLLAQYVPALTPLRFVELGTGCGMAACALALRLPHAQGIGVDCDAAATDAARRNFRTLGLEHRLTAHVADVAHIPSLRALVSTPPHVVMANPPYRAAHAGRPPLQAERRQALVGNPDTLDIFCAAAFALLPHGGRFCCVFSASRLSTLIATLQRHRLGLRRLRSVHTRPEADARLIMAEARKDCADDARLEPPLLLSPSRHAFPPPAE